MGPVQVKIRPDHHSVNAKCPLPASELPSDMQICKTSHHAMFPCKARSSKQADIHLKLSMPPHHAIPRSPLPMCYRTSDQHVGKWKHRDRQMFETAAMLKFLKLQRRKLQSPPRIGKSSKHDERTLQCAQEDILSSHPSPRS